MITADQFRARVTETLCNAAGRRSLANHFVTLLPEIVELRNDDVRWDWIATTLSSVRGDAQIKSQRLRALYSVHRKGERAAAEGKKTSRAAVASTTRGQNAGQGPTADGATMLRVTERVRHWGEDASELDSS